MILARANVLQPVIGCHQQCRGMATLKTISMRLKSVKNIQKITQSMKMVSAAKYSRAERELRQARPYGEGTKIFFEKIIPAAGGGEKKTEEDTNANAKKLLIAVTSDRGLCGAVHTSVARQIRGELAECADNVQVVCIGDKSRTILQRLYGKNIIFVANEVGKKPPTFQDAAKIAEQVAHYQFSSGKIVYNRFKSVVSYMTSELPLYDKETVAASQNLTLYDSVDEDVLQSYLEFMLTSLLYYAMKEGACSEQSSRMTAMDNASKNAGEMIDKLALTFNRTRQAVITRELIEIISGASAL